MTDDAMPDDGIRQLVAMARLAIPDHELAAARQRFASLMVEIEKLHGLPLQDAEPAFTFRPGEPRR